MRNIFFLLVLFMSSHICYGQVNLEASLDKAVYSVQLDGLGEMYYGIDYQLNTCTIYRDDYTTYKSIAIDVPDNQTLYEVAYVSTRLFNNDDQVELLVVFYEYRSTSDTSGYLVYTTKVVNEVGVTFLNLPNGGYSTVYNQENDLSKLLCFVYDFSVSPYSVFTNVYSIPGKWNGVKEESPNSNANPFPNPAHGFINIPIPDDFKGQSSELYWLDFTGKVIKHQFLSTDQSAVTVGTERLPAGISYYYIETENAKTSIKKVIVQ